MQLFKRIFVATIAIIYSFSSVGGQRQFFKIPQVEAAGDATKVDLVAIFVDNAIYGAIQGDLGWYTDTYIPKQSPGTKSLIFPIDTAGFAAADIQHILENLYFDGQQGTPSQLVGVILFGEIPLPVVELDGKRFGSIYPYVDFVDPMFVYDQASDLFIYNDHPDSLPEAWHSMIPINEPDVFIKFFEKLKEYDQDPKKYADTKVWYDDFIYLKQAYTEEELDRYINTLLFAEANSYRKSSTLLQNILSKEEQDDLINKVEETRAAVQEGGATALADPELGEDEEVLTAAQTLIASSQAVMQELDTEELMKGLIQSAEMPIPTIALERVMMQNFTPNHTIFGNTYLTDLQQNLLAGGRYQLVDIDTSLEKIEIKDRVVKQYLQDMNTVMEAAVDRMIDEQQYDLKYPLPYLYVKHVPWIQKPGVCAELIEEPYTSEYLMEVFTGQNLVPGSVIQHGAFKGAVFINDEVGFDVSNMTKPIGFQTEQLARYENHYFGRNAVDINSYQELSIFRGEYVNQNDVSASLATATDAFIEKLEDVPEFKIEEISMGASLGHLGQQVEQNRAYNFDLIFDDKQTYDDYECDDEDVDEFSMMFRGGASLMNLDTDAFGEDPKHPITQLDQTWTPRTLISPLANIASPLPSMVELDYASWLIHELTQFWPAWNPSLERWVGGAWEDVAGGVQVARQVDRDSIHQLAHRDFGVMVELRSFPLETQAPGGFRDRLGGMFTPKPGLYNSVRNHHVNRCKPRPPLNDDPTRTSFDEVDFFHVYEDKRPEAPEYLRILVNPGLVTDEDIDNDGIPNQLDDDMDGDGIPNQLDDDMDGDRIPNTEDSDMDGDGIENEDDLDVDGDGIPNWADEDIDGDGIPNSEDEDIDGDGIPNSEDEDIDGDGVPNSEDTDMDGDGIPNGSDPDIDGDGIPNGQDDDMDGDGIPNGQDGDCNGNGIPNGQDPDVDGDGIPNGQDDDVDGDGIPNGEDPDVDGDGLPNEDDNDIDGDGLLNEDDDDMDGDGLPNSQDPDIDGDGILNSDDETPNGPVFTPLTPGGLGGAFGGILDPNEPINCEGSPIDVDDDGIPNGEDPDIDGDGIPNWDDDDMDGDGIPNSEDSDMDCDGTPNGQDSDMDCDGVPNSSDGDCNGNDTPNGEDPDVDGDGIPNGEDPDVDGDGIPNEMDPDIDGDGVHNGEDSDSDGDGVSNGNDPDVDGDGIPNGEDRDVDGDGMPNGSDPDIDGDGIPNEMDPDMDGDGIPNEEDDDMDGDGITYDQEGGVNGKLTAQMEERGAECFELGHDYRYKIIDTIVEHKDPVENDLIDMTAMTFERPIDDPRYVTFHGIGGDVVKFIYPNLYHVPVYECELLTQEAIKEKLIEYLQQKVQIYNQYLSAQMDGSLAQYGEHPAAYDFLETVHPAATPKREYEIFPENFFIDLVGDENLDRMAEGLYYLSVPWEKKPSTGSFGEYIQQAREHFDLDTKLETIYDDYLQYDDPADEFKFDKIAYPTHIEPKLTYEMGYINSDGLDVIQQSKAETPVLEDTPISQPPVGDENVPPEPDNPPGGGNAAETAANEDDVECGITADQGVPLMKRPKAFACWLKKTIEKPFEFEIYIGVELDDAYDERFREWQQKTDRTFGRLTVAVPGQAQVNNPTAYYTNVLAGLGSSVYAQSATDRGFSSYISSDQRDSYVNAHARADLSPDNQKVFDKLQQEIDIGLDSEPYIQIGDDATTKNLRITADASLGNIQVRISQYGNNCTIVSSTNLCQQDLNLTFDPGTTPTSLPMKLANNLAGTNVVQVTTCQGGICTQHDILLHIVSAPLDRLALTLPGDVAIQGGTFPLAVRGFDEYDNAITFSTVPYTMHVVGATFQGDLEGATRTITHFPESAYLINTSGSTATGVTISLVPADPALPTLTHTIPLVAGSLDITSTHQSGQEIVYRLPHAKTGFTIVNAQGAIELRDELLPHVTIDLNTPTKNPGDALVHPLSIESTYGLVQIGRTVAKETDLGFAQHAFSETDTFLYEGSPVQVTLLPNGKAGYDELIIRSPGLPEQVLPIIIKPSGPEVMDISFSQTQYASSGDVVVGQVTLQDSWGNSYTEPAQVELDPFGEFEVDGDLALVVSGGYAVFTGMVTGGGGCGCRGRVSQSQVMLDEGGSGSQGDPTGGDSGSNGGTNPGGSGVFVDPSVGGPITDPNNPGGSDNDGGSSDDGSGGDGEDSGSEDGEDGSGGDNEGENSEEICTYEEELPTDLPDENRYQEGYVFAEGEFTAQTVLWPNDPEEDDINIMYLNLFGKAWGNNKDTVRYLKNSKTLSITTQFHPDAFSAAGTVATLVHPDGRIQDPLNIVSELRADGGELVVVLGRQEGIGRVNLGSYTEFDFYSLNPPSSPDGERGLVIYSPGALDSFITSNRMDTYKIWVNDLLMVDFARGYMHPEVQMILGGVSGSYQTWQLLYQNKPVGTVAVWRNPKPLAPHVRLYHGGYDIENMPFGSSTNADIALSIVQLPQGGFEGDSSLFESIHSAINPRKDVGFRHQFMNMTNFAQGLTVGQATQHFGGPFVINFGDPFLKRVKENRTVQSTDYDDGIGKIIFSDSDDILDVDTIDYNKDGKLDVLVAYKDGAIRILQQHGGGHPFMDLGMLLVVADGIKEMFVGDVDGDGWQDIMVRTSSDKMRVYRNDEGVYEVNGQIVCLDIPNGDKNVAQVRQLYAEDMDGDGTLDIITNDINGDIKVFYGGSNSGGGNYLSTDPFVCDDEWKGRQQMQLVKSFGLQLGGPIADQSLRYWPGLKPLDMEEDVSFDESSLEAELGLTPPKPFEDMSKKELKEYGKYARERGAQIPNDIDPQELLDQASKVIDLVIAPPDDLRPIPEIGNPEYGVIRAIDPVPEGYTSWFEVSKQFVDQDGGNLLKGDLVDIHVSLIPVGGVGNVTYREKLDGPWIIYKDEYNKIDPFDFGDMSEDTDIDWNVGQGYEFRITDLPLGGTVTFTYTVQYNGDGYVNIDIETIKKELFKGPTESSFIGSLFGSVFAQGGREKRIRAFPVDACYKQYRLFSPGESIVNLQDYLDEKTKEYEDFFNGQREEMTEKIVEDEDLNAMKIKDFIGFLPPLVNTSFESWKDARINALFGGGLEDFDFEIDTEAYLDYFVDEAVMKIEKLLKDKAGGLIKQESLGMFEDFEFGYQKCSGINFGKDLCGQGLPIPFNMDFLSPGTFNIMGCKLFDFKGLPLVAFPTNGTVPIWPVFPSGAGGIFGGSTSQLRLYVSPTLTAGLGVSICFSPFTVGMKIKSPPGDFVGNCLVIAGNIGPQCKTGNPVKETNLKEQESRYIAEEEQRDLGRIGVCEQRLHESQPFVAPELGDKVIIGGKPVSVQGTNYREQRDTTNFTTAEINLAGSNAGGVESELITFDREYLRGGTSLDLKIEGGNVRGLAQCIVRKWVENQTRYYANNALHMHIDIMLPDISKLGENIDKLKDVEDLWAFQFDREQFGKAFESIQSPGTTSKQQDNTQKNQVNIFPSKSLLTSINTTLNNPFETVAAYFENIPLVNFEERTTSFEIPWFYQEDLARYEVHLRSWITRNEARVAAWEENSGANADVVTLMKQQLNAARKNLTVLDQYRELPLKINALLHSYDQYLIEVYRFIDSFITQIVSWLQVNANRFSQWVDLALLLIGIAETRQVLIDFSVERHSKCAKCRQDNYDFYSCKLRMLCFDLPVLPIPNFNIPDIYLDLSKIDIGIDIIIPRFNFVPRKMVFPRLPELPDSIELPVDIDIPQIPILPSPPPLPEIPRLDMDIDIELPTLPPPPRIPKLLPVIKVVVKIADFIGTLLCLVKGSIGLVAEQGVKTRVEQMTQRKQDVEPFDSLKITWPESPQAGYDYKIDGYLDVKVDFAVLYDVVDGIADQWNEAVDVPFEKAREETRKAINDIGESIDGAIEDVLDGIDPSDEDFGDWEGGVEIGPGGIEINLDEMGALPESELLAQTLGISLPPELQSYLDAKTNRYIGGEVPEVRAALLDGLAYLTTRPDLSHYLPAVEDIQRVLTTDHRTQPNFAGLETVRQRIEKDLQILREENHGTMTLLAEGYDKFVDTLSTKTLISDATTTKTYSSSLFVGDDSLVERLQEQPSLTETYIELHKPFVEGFKQSLQTHSPYELDMNALEHASLLGYFTDLSEKISVTEQVVATTHQGPLLAAVSPDDPSSGGGGHNHGGGTPTGGTPTGSAGGTPPPTSLDVDFSQFIEGFLVPGKDGDYHDIIAWTEKANQFYRGNLYHVVDINSDGEQDILLYDANRIYVKYGKQKIDHPGGGAGGGYVLGPFASMQSLIDQVQETQGRYEGAGGTYKLRDEEMVRYEFVRHGQDHASMVFSWENDPRVAGWVVELADHVAFNYEKDRGSSRSKEIRYLVVLPETLSEQGLDIEIEDQLPRDSLQDYQEDGKIVDIRHYDGSVESVQSLLEDIEKKRYYTKVAPLRLEQSSSGGGGILGFFGIGRGRSSDFVLKKVGPWSRQEVAGVQYRADDQPPVPKVEMIRDLTGEKVAQGTLLLGNINTKYTIDVKREDNAKVVENWVIRSGQEVKREVGEELKLEDLKFNQPREDYLTFAAIDQAGNLAHQQVVLRIGVPTIEIDEIIYQGLGADIVAELSTTIDEGLVKFQRERYGYREPLQPDTYPVNPTDPKVKGGLYPFDTDITLFDEEGNPIGTIDSESGQIDLPTCTSGGSCSGGSNNNNNSNNQGGNQGNNQGSNNQGGNSGSSSGSGSGSNSGGTNGSQGTGNNQGSGSGGQGGSSNTGENEVSMFVDFVETGYPKLHIVVDGVTIFTVNVVSEQLYGDQPMVLLDGTYQILPLDNGYFGDFAGGWCVGPVGDECHIFVSEEGNVYLPVPYRYNYLADYFYDDIAGYASYVIHTSAGDEVLRIDFIPKPFN